MEELKHELEKLAKTYVDTPEKEEKDIDSFYQAIIRTPDERKTESDSNYRRTAI